MRATATAGVLGLALLGASCSVLFDPSGAGSRDASAGGDRSPLLDGDPNVAPVIESAQPSSLVEGVGSSGSGPKAVLLLEGTGFQPDAMLTAGSGAEVVPQSECASADGTLFAARVRIPVAPSRGPADQNQVSFTVDEAGGTDEVAVSVDWLPELDGGLALAGVESRYSAIELTSNLVAVGPGGPVELFATGDIRIRADIDASGADGVDGGAAGRGGCAGGNPAVKGGDGGCGHGGGKGGSGGGGGGYAASGDSGGGSEPGAGGDLCGSEDLYPFGTDTSSDNRGNGGGAGSSGGAGGGGGGVVVLWTPGDLMITADIDAEGGAGESCGNGAASGGGGSGGAILLHAGHLEADTDVIDLNVAGGQGGLSVACATGGAGSVGRMRFDAAELQAELKVDAYRGPIFANGTRQVIGGDGNFGAVLIGEPGASFDVYLNSDADPTSVAIDGSGHGTYSAQLVQGLNEICVLVPSAAGPPNDVGETGRTCLTVAYLPGGDCP